MEITVNLFAIVLLSAANGFFVAAEFALVKARGRAGYAQRPREGDRFRGCG